MARLPNTEPNDAETNIVSDTSTAGSTNAHHTGAPTRSAAKPLKAERHNTGVMTRAAAKRLAHTRGASEETVNSSEGTDSSMDDSEDEEAVPHEGIRRGDSDLEPHTAEAPDLPVPVHQRGSKVLDVEATAAVMIEREDPILAKVTKPKLWKGPTKRVKWTDTPAFDQVCIGVADETGDDDWMMCEAGLAANDDANFSEMNPSAFKDMFENPTKFEDHGTIQTLSKEPSGEMQSSRSSPR